MDHEESSLFSSTLLSPTSLPWQFHHQLPIFQNKAHPNTTYDFKEVKQKGNKNLDIFLIKWLDKPQNCLISQYFFLELLQLWVFLPWTPKLITSQNKWQLMHPPNSLKDPNENPKMKQWKKKGVKARSLAHNTSKVGKHVRISRWD